MGWLDTIRSLLDLDSGDDGEDYSTVEVTLEKEPDVTSERAVKEPVETTGAAAVESSDEEAEKKIDDGVGGAADDEAESERTPSDDETGTDTVAGTVEEDGAPSTEDTGLKKDGDSEMDGAGLEEEGKSEMAEGGLENDDEPGGESVPDEDGEPDEPGSVALTDLQGIGSAYADRLEEAGVEDVDALATADPDNLAERANISEKRIQRWIDRARDR